MAPIPLVHLLIHGSIVPRIKPSALIIHNLGLLIFLQHPIHSSLAFLINVVDVFPLPFPFRISFRLLYFFRLR
jgi:hypothetical protein